MENDTIDNVFLYVCRGADIEDIRELDIYTIATSEQDATEQGIDIEPGFGMWYQYEIGIDPDDGVEILKNPTPRPDIPPGEM